MDDYFELTALRRQTPLLATIATQFYCSKTEADKNTVQELTRTARIALTAVTHKLTECGPVNLLVELAAHAGELMLCVKILQRFTHAEKRQRGVENPLQNIGYCVEFSQLENENH